MPSKERVWNENDGKPQRVLHVLVLVVTCIDHEDGPLGVSVLMYRGNGIVVTAFRVKVAVHFRS
jgi:hypothetical protein